MTPDPQGQAPGNQAPERVIGQPFNPYKLCPGSLIPEPICRYRGLSPGAKLIYGRLYRYAGKNGAAFPGIATLAEETGLGETQAREYVLRTKIDSGWNPPNWKSYPAVVRHKFERRQNRARGKRWSDSDLATLRAGLKKYMEGDEPPERFEHSCELRANGATAREVFDLIERRWRNKKYWPGGQHGPRGWNWGRSCRIRFRTGATGVTGDVAGRDGAVRCSQVGHAVPTALTPPARK